MKLQNVLFGKKKDQVATTTSSSINDDNVDECVHIRVRQRNNRKRITILYKLPASHSSEKKMKDMLKYLKNKLSCGGFIGETEKYGKFIQFTGDHHKELQEYLLDNNIVTSVEKIKMHGGE